MLQETNPLLLPVVWLAFSAECSRFSFVTSAISAPLGSVQSDNEILSPSTSEPGALWRTYIYFISVLWIYKQSSNNELVTLITGLLKRGGGWMNRHLSNQGTWHKCRKSNITWDLSRASSVQYTRYNSRYTLSNLVNVPESFSNS
jgi:hypothetical protein